MVFLVLYGVTIEMKNVYYIVVLLFFSLGLNAQEYSHFAINYKIGVPVGQDLFVEDASFSGFEIEYHAFLNHRSDISLGGSFGLAAFDEYLDRSTYPLENGAITTDIYKYLRVMPILFHAKYYLRPTSDSKITPVFGLGVGATYVEEDLFFSINQIAGSTWGFSLRPNAELLFGPFNFSRNYMKVGAAYNFSTNSSDFTSATNYGDFSFYIGVIFNDF